MVVKLTKDFVRVAKRLAARAKKNGIVPPIIAIGHGRCEASDGYVVVSVPADHDSPIVGFDPAKLKATHEATVERAGDVHQSNESVTEIIGGVIWPNFRSLRSPEGMPFAVEPQLLIDALDVFPKDGRTVKVYLSTNIVILGPDGHEARFMPHQEVLL